MPASHVLFLPGLMCDRRLFARQIDMLDVEATVADLTRHADFVAMARAVLQEAPTEFALVGLSMGGIVAFEIWRQAPERVTHLALLDTNPHPDTPAKKNMRLDHIRLAAEGGLRELAVESLKPVYLAEANRDDEELLETVLDMAIDLGPEVFERQSLALKDRADSAVTLPSISVPTAVICGDEDRLCPPSLHEYMAARIPGARLAIAPQCGHLATMESPEFVNQQLQQLLAA